jgi:hypothetical protein
MSPSADSGSEQVQIGIIQKNEFYSKIRMVFPGAGLLFDA